MTNSGSKNQNLQSKILKNIENVEIKSKNYFTLRNVFFGILIVVCLVMAMLTLASFFYDSGSLVEMLEITSLQDIRFLNSFLFELLFFSLLLIFLIFIVYRQTDWLLVRQKDLLLLILFLILISVSSAIAFFLPQNDDILVENLEKLPYRKERALKVLKELESKEVFVGIVVRTPGSRMRQELEIINPEKAVIFKVPENLQRMANRLQDGQAVAVRFYYNNQTEEIILKEIRLLENKQNRFLPPRQRPMQ